MTTNTNKELTENLRALLNKVDELTTACLEISRFDHQKIDLAKKRTMENYAELCDAVLTVRENLEVRSAVKNAIDQIYCDIIEQRE